MDDTVSTRKMFGAGCVEGRYLLLLVIVTTCIGNSLQDGECRVEIYTIHVHADYIKLVYLNNIRFIFFERERSIIKCHSRIAIIRNVQLIKVLIQW